MPFLSEAPYCTVPLNGQTYGTLPKWSPLLWPTLEEHLIVPYPSEALNCILPLWSTLLYPCQVERLILHFPSGAPYSTYLSGAPNYILPLWDSLCYPTQQEHLIAPFPNKWSTLSCPI